MLWKIRAALGRKFTDKLVSRAYRVAVHSPQEILHPDMNVVFKQALKIADGIVEAYQQRWPTIQRILEEKHIEVAFRLRRGNAY
jgi:hypothetical protein